MGVCRSGQMVQDPKKEKGEEVRQQRSGAVHLTPAHTATSCVSSQQDRVASLFDKARQVRNLRCAGALRRALR